ncbi:hypothetical protein NL676_035376 [Syzygium grande]|nr:hypothetical protein NL676_035376 [Syzygium grande]
MGDPLGSGRREVVWASWGGKDHIDRQKVFRISSPFSPSHSVRGMFSRLREGGSPSPRFLSLHFPFPLRGAPKRSLLADFLADSSSSPSDLQNWIEMVSSSSFD